MTTQDYVKKALLDTQERVRDFQRYSQQIEDRNLQSLFKKFAENEGTQASQLQDIIQSWEKR